MNQQAHSDRGHAEFSPSSLKYVAGCSGYKGREGTNAAAEMGTRIHEAIEIRDPSNLQSEKELQIYEEICSDQNNYLESFDPSTLTDSYSEILLDIDLNGTSTFGTCDFLNVYGDEAVLIDYKTGISKIDTPDQNWQSKAYTIGCFQKFPNLKQITFVFFIPQRNEILEHSFKRDQLDDLVDELSKVILKAEKVRPLWEDGHPLPEDLTPTINCRFCKFEDVCPALGGLVVEVAKKINPQLPDVDLEEVDDPQIIEQLWAISKIVTNWAERFKKRAVKLAQEGMEFPNLELKASNGARKVVDQSTFFAIAKEYGLNAEQILSQVSIPVAKVAKVVGDQAEKGAKKAQAENFLESCQEAGVIERSSPRHTLS